MSKKTYVFREERVGVKKGREKDDESNYSRIKRSERIDKLTGIKKNTYFSKPMSPYKPDEILSTSKFKIINARERSMPLDQGGYQLNLLIKDGDREVNHTIYGKDAVSKFKKIVGANSDRGLLGKNVGANIVYKGFRGSDGKMHNVNDVSSLEVEALENEEEENNDKSIKKKSKKVKQDRNFL